MKHLDTLSTLTNNTSIDFQIRTTGKYYTPQLIQSRVITVLLELIAKKKSLTDSIRIADPFAGDGRLVVWLIEAWLLHRLPKIHWDIFLFDLDEDGLKLASFNLNALREKGVSITYKLITSDTFRISKSYNCWFDVVVTNPPWVLLKPDRRVLREFDEKTRIAYISSMKKYDVLLAEEYMLSQPIRKFAGWGTNLSRVGAEVSFNICKVDGIVAIVLPASFFADYQSKNLRKMLFENTHFYDIAYYPSEARLFKPADVASSTLIFRKTIETATTAKLTIFDKDLIVKSCDVLSLSKYKSITDDYIIPISLGGGAINLMERMREPLQSIGQIEKSSNDLWIGRELDETGSKNWLSDTGTGPKFVKGNMIERFKIREIPSQYVDKMNWKPANSSSYERIAWRDVSRPNQKRRMIATIIPKNTIAGNSLGIIYFKTPDQRALYSLLGVINSICFEFQLRYYLSTGHISLSAMRKVHLPSKNVLSRMTELNCAVKSNLKNNAYTSSKIEAIVAKEVYGINKTELEALIGAFDKLTAKEKENILKEYNILSENKISNSNKIKLPNHRSAKLSNLDMKIVDAVPPGGNWKNIPLITTSKRIEQIRNGYKLGKGSRSTYYGRLHPSRPSYTISTNFNRPGMGCNIHYEQERVISQREAARLQSFPDGFIFEGSQTAINTQIGNAVPPLLAYQIANKVSKAIGRKGVFVDLFCGAGGMGLGFKWAGWKPFLATDIEPKFLETYSNNIHSNVLSGSITDVDTFSEIVEQCRKQKVINRKTPLWILGGPPCQGFSTAGNKRSMNDKRNTLFLNYKELLKEVVPDGFVFENVAGLLNMENGRVFEQVKSEFKSVMLNQVGWVIRSEHFAIPQRRKRVFLVGSNTEGFKIEPPEPITSKREENDMFFNLENWITVRDALSDLPRISQGEDGSTLDYLSNPQNSYQKLMRGLISPSEYLSKFHR